MLESTLSASSAMFPYEYNLLTGDFREKRRAGEFGVFESSTLGKNMEEY